MRTYLKRGTAHQNLLLLTLEHRVGPVGVHGKNWERRVVEEPEDDKGLYALASIWDSGEKRAGTVVDWMQSRKCRDGGQIDKRSTKAGK